MFAEVKNALPEVTGRMTLTFIIFKLYSLEVIFNKTFLLCHYRVLHKEESVFRRNRYPYQ